MLDRFFPLLAQLRRADGSALRADLLAGLTVGVMLVPQGMAYAYLAGMPPIYGLYAGLVPPVVYALLGTSRQLSIGPVAVSALLVLAGVSQLAEPGSAEYVRLTIAAGLLIGLLQVALGICRAGKLSGLLSHPVLAGFTSAAAIIIAVSQLKDLLGIRIPNSEHSYEIAYYAVTHLGETSLLSVGFCLTAMLVMLSLQRINRRLPAALVVVLLGTLLAWWGELDKQNLAIIREVPSGLPAFGRPPMDVNTLIRLLPTVITVALIGFVESISIARVFDRRNGVREVRPNQELYALGISKVAGSFFQALPSSGSFTRSAVNYDNGAKTALSNVFTALVIGLTLLFLTGLFYYLPKAILAAIILLAVRSLFDYQEALHLWHTDKLDFVTMAATFLLTLLLGIEIGVLCGVLLSLALLYARPARPGRLHITLREGGYHLRGPLYFLNIDRLRNELPTNSDAPIRIDTSGITGMDSSGRAALELLHG